MTSYRIIRQADFHRVKTVPGCEFVWSSELDEACAASHFSSYNQAFRALGKVQDLTNDVYYVLEYNIPANTGRTTW